MGCDFRRLMNQQSALVMREMERLCSFCSYGKSKRTRIHVKARVLESIKGRDEFRHMVDCIEGRGNSCHSVFCPKCREAKQDRMFQKFMGQYVKRFNLDESEARKNLRYVTVLHAMVPADVSSESAEGETVERIVRATEEIKESVLKIDRRGKERFGKAFWAHGSFHLELVDYELFKFSEMFGMKTKKQGVYLDLIEAKSNNPGGYFFSVHAHFLFDNDGLDDGAAKQLLGEIWSTTANQIDYTPLTTHYGGGKEHKIETAFRNLAKYAFNGSNSKLRFKSNFGDTDRVYSVKAETGERRTLKEEVNLFVEATSEDSESIDEQLSNGDVRLLIRAHNALTDNGKRGLVLLIR